MTVRHGKGIILRRRPILGLVPVILAATATATATLASPQPARAAGGIVETGTTTYVVNPAKSEIDVTVQLAITNNIPFKETPVPCGSMTCIQETDYLVGAAYVWVPIQAVAIKARGETSGGAPSAARRVSVSTYKTSVDARELKLRFMSVGWGGTRHVTVTYIIPAAPHAPGGYRALKAYTEFCASGSGVDSGSLSVVVPDGFDVAFSSGTKLVMSGDSKGVQTYGSGTVSAPYNLWTCVQAVNPSGLTTTSLTAGDQSFDMHAWPEDSTWASKVRDDILLDIPRLEELTGLQMPGGIVAINEAGNSELGEYAGMYDSTTKVATVTENTDEATVAHELSHIWFNPDLFTDTWMDEGFAGYSERVAGAANYKPCADPGLYPGTGSPNLMTWRYLSKDSTAADSKVVDWQYAASCSLVTEVADTIGPATFKTVLVAASKGEMAYVGAPPTEASPNGAPPNSAPNLLDLIEELGAVSAGSADQDKIEAPFVKDGIFTSLELDTRTQARSAYEQLSSTVGSWKMPLAIRRAMSWWEFPTAKTAMDTATQILTVRDQATKNLPGLSLDGTPLETMFESAKTQSDLDAALNLAKKVAAAAAKVQQAKLSNDGSRNILQMIGLIGTDLSGPLVQSNTALKNAKPDDATAAAQKVVDAVNGSSNQGLMRVGLATGILVVALLLLFLLVVLLRRRGRSRNAVAATVAVAPAVAPVDDSFAASPESLEVFGPLDGGQVRLAGDQSSAAAGRQEAPGPADQHDEGVGEAD